MAKMIYGMLMSLDFYIEGPEGGPRLPPPGAELHRHFNDWMRRISVALYGRRMYEIMRFWDTWDERPEASEVAIDFARAWRDTPKVVVSTTLRELGPNATLIASDIESAVTSLKSRTEGEIAVAGAGLATSLARLGLIDEYRLYLHPLVLGGGKLFLEKGLPLELEPLGAESLPQGVTLLRYAKA
jgi:dihydrofolate reductase